MKKLILLTSLFFLSPIQAELLALDSDELENELAITNITAFQNSASPILFPPSAIPVDNDFRIQQEVNALLITAPIDPNISNTIRLESQLLQGPNSGIEVINNNLLNF
jgi:hypothetical protein